ncbi:MAG: sigma-54-dependent Fis family transcriptional regulator [Anaerolineales bacterium]
MQAGAHSPDLHRLDTLWRHFLATNQLLPELDPLVAQSWRRCAPRLNPHSPLHWAYVSAEVWPLTLNQHITMLAIARPIMEDVHQYIDGSGAVLILADNTDCVLECLGDSELLSSARDFGLRPGAFLDESRIGTNGWAVALIERSPAQIIGAEHFSVQWHAYASAAAPIFDVDGNPVGTIGLLERCTQRSPHSLGIAVAAAKAIENQLQANLFVREANAHATELNAAMDAISEGVLAWTAQGLIMHLNHMAGELLGLAPATVVGRRLGEYVTLPESLARAVGQGEEVNDSEANLRLLDGATCACLVSLRVVRGADGQPEMFIATLRRLDQVRQLVTRLVGAQARLTLDDIVGHGVPARRVRKQALAAAEAKACVLLVGESGTGKNVLARAIHNSGRRSAGPFLAVNCRAIPRELALGEFMGFEAGAFNSGQTIGQPSKFELAHGGTLFLEEVEALPLEVQTALLRVIEAGDVIRLGGTRVIPVDTRLIVSTASQLEARVAEGSFRADLLLRLSSFVINPLPVRERPEDIPLLIERLLEKLSVQLGQHLAITPGALTALRAYPWPGNIRELESVIERATVASEGHPIATEHLPPAIRQRRALAPGKQSTELVRSLQESEESAILAAGRAARGHLTQAAQLLGVSRTTLWRKMKALGIAIEDFRR